MMHFQADGERIVSTAVRSAWVWDWNGRLLRELGPHDARVWDADFSADGRYLATSSVARSIIVWDVDRAQQVRSLALDEGARTVTWSPDGRALAVTHLSGKAALIDARTAAVIHELRGLSAGTHFVRFEPDLGLVIGYGTTPPMVVWRADTGAVQWTVAAHPVRQREVARHPTRPILASVGDDHAVRLFDLRSGAPAGELAGHEQRVHTLAFSEEGARLATGGDDRSVRIWRPDDPGRAPQILRGHTHPIMGVRFVPGRPDTLLSVAQDGTARLWNVETSGLIRTIAAPPQARDYLAIHRSGGRFVASSIRGEAGIYRIGASMEPGSPVERSGRLTNLRACPDGAAVAVIPPPDPASVFAPDALCHNGGR